MSEIIEFFLSLPWFVWLFLWFELHFLASIIYQFFSNSEVHYDSSKSYVLTARHARIHVINELLDPEFISYRVYNSSLYLWRVSKGAGYDRLFYEIKDDSGDLFFFSIVLPSKKYLSDVSFSREKKYLKPFYNRTLVSMLFLALVFPVSYWNVSPYRDWLELLYMYLILIFYMLFFYIVLALNSKTDYGIEAYLRVIGSSIMYHPGLDRQVEVHQVILAFTDKLRSDELHTLNLKQEAGK